MTPGGLMLIHLNPEQAAPKILAKDTTFVATLGDISSDILRLPNSVGSLQGLEKRGQIAVASGGTTDIWRGTWNGQQVAFKTFRIYPPQDLQEAKKILWKVVPTWKRLVHENVLPFHGVDTSTFQLALIYDWGPNGNITQYLESNPGASRHKLVGNCLCFVRNAFSDRPSKLLQVARGLQYLHSFGIVHGDLKGVSEPASFQTPAKPMDFSLG
jgi:serine/threonine protein kinase